MNKPKLVISVGKSLGLLKLIYELLLDQGYSKCTSALDSAIHRINIGKNVFLYADFGNRIATDSNGKVREGEWVGAIAVDANTEMAKLMDLLIPGNPKVKLNDRYTAEITKDGVIVGCTTFTHAVILEVAAKIKEVQS